MINEIIKQMNLALEEISVLDLNYGKEDILKDAFKSEHIDRFLNNLQSRIVITNLDETEGFVLDNCKDKLGSIKSPLAINEKEKINVYNYFYWKYIKFFPGKPRAMHIRNYMMKLNEMFNICPIKNIYAYLKSNIIPFDAEVLCPVCGQNAKIRIHYIMGEVIDVKCTCCGHIDKITEDPKELLIKGPKCNCLSCKKVKGKIFAYFRKATFSLINEVANEIKVNFESYVESESSSEKLFNKKWYILFNCYLEKEEKLIVEIKPKGIQDICERIANMHEAMELDIPLDRFQDELIKKLEEHRVIYKKNFKGKKNYHELALEVIIDNIADSLREYFIKTRSIIKHIDQDIRIRTSCELVDLMRFADIDEFYKVITGKKEQLFYLEKKNERSRELDIFLLERFPQIYINYEKFLLNEEYVINGFYMED